MSLPLVNGLPVCEAKLALSRRLHMLYYKRRHTGKYTGPLNSTLTGRLLAQRQLGNPLAQYIL